MDKHVIYCTGCDREVTVLLREERGGRLAGASAGGEPELCGAVCLEIGPRCMGTSCPICAVSAAEAGEAGKRAEDTAAA